MNRQYRHSMNSNHVTPSGDIPALSTSPSDPSSIIRHPLSIPPTSSLVLLDDPALHPSGIIPTLQNVVSTANVNCILNLRQIALSARNAEYNPKRFSAVIMRIREPKTTALIFSSGKMVVTGSRNEEASRFAARKFARILQKIGFNITFTDFLIQNVMASCDVGFAIRLEGLQYCHGGACTYEPELFPGLIYRMQSPKLVFLIFVSGKIVITGAKRREDIYLAFEKFFPVLLDFKK